MEQLKRTLPASPAATLAVYADGMGNDVQTLLNAWPTRFFLFLQGPHASPPRTQRATSGAIAAARA